jgi:hypothetical protein
VSHRETLKYASNALGNVIGGNNSQDRVDRVGLSSGAAKPQKENSNGNLDKCCSGDIGK